MNTVRTLRISDNELSTLDMSDFPKLRTLYADGNRISSLSRSRSHGNDVSRLENLSLRNQRCSNLRISSTELAPVKRLYVSGEPFIPYSIPSVPPGGMITDFFVGNKLDSHFFPHSLPNLLYLEAAACSLSTLPSNFANCMSNLKILNLNYNFLSSLDGLGGLRKLRKLTVVGCRLGGKEKGLVQSLRGLQGLEELDLRYVVSQSTLHHP